jgi:hypothetical protein
MSVVSRAAHQTDGSHESQEIYENRQFHSKPSPGLWVKWVVPAATKPLFVKLASVLLQSVRIGWYSSRLL